MNSYCELELCLEDILSLVKPSESDRDRLDRVNTVSELSNIVRSIESLKGVTCESTSKFIAHARVPLVIYESKLYNISCDISINSLPGQIKSEVLLWISEIDERFHDLVLLVKEWAKAKNINNAKTGTLNSFSLCMLVLFHFQTCDPPILPSLKEVYEGNLINDVTGPGWVREVDIKDAICARIQHFKFQECRRRNESSLSHLLVSFFDKYSRLERLSGEYALSTYTGKWKCIKNNPVWIGKSWSLVVEDPFEQTENCARAVSPKGLRDVCDAFAEAYAKLNSQAALLDRNSLLATLARSDIALQLQARKKSSNAANRSSNSHSIRLPRHGKFQNTCARLHNGLKLNDSPQASTVTMRKQLQAKKKQMPVGVEAKTIKLMTISSHSR